MTLVFQLARQPRCGVMLKANADLSPGRWRDLIGTAAAALQTQNPDAKVVGSVRLPLDAELALQLAHRRIGSPIDGVLEITLSPSMDHAHLLDFVPGILSSLRRAIDAEHCTAVAGDVLHAMAGYGSHMFVHLGWLDPQTDAEGFIKWWASHHAVVSAESSAGDPMAGYNILPRYDALTSEINAALGFADGGDIYQSIYFNDMQRWNSSITPEMAQAALEDETGWLKREPTRAALMQVVSRG
jgi:hypothetical protein